MANGKPEQLLDDVIDAKVSAILAERYGDICDDSQNQEELDAKAAKLVQILRDQTQKMEVPQVEARGRIQKRRKRKKARAKEKTRAKANKQKKKKQYPSFHLSQQM